LKILCTGNLGYVGSVLEPFLISRGHQVLGFDSCLYEDCLLHPIPDNYLQIRKDIRDVERIDCQQIDAVIHLAALSNDPLGEFSTNLTEEINLMGTVRLAEIAKSMGVKRFVYASSQSMYGISETQVELDEYDSEKNAITAYAATKWEAECELSRMNSAEFQVVAMRPSTIFGASPRLRCDIVFNNLVACAHTSGTIEIKSDGTPWRPVVHILDVCSAFLAGLEAPAELVSGRAYNVGIPEGNFTVRDLAEAAQRSVPGSELVFTNEHGSDSRTYRVGFKRILAELKDYYNPAWNLDSGARELIRLFQKVDFKKEHFRGINCNRLKKINNLISEGKLDHDLRWQ